MFQVQLSLYFYLTTSISIVSAFFSLVAHPNIKLFIYQGGLQSTEEAIYHGIPLVGLPIIWDQIYQLQNVVRLGIGARLQINNLSKESIEASIHEVISNKRYYCINQD